MVTPSSIKTLSFDFERNSGIPDFDSIRIKLASPEEIRAWSQGEITRPETINYRTQKPEKDGLFCQKIFGPVKDWQCACGKYKKIRYKGIVCDKCGVEVTRSVVRRERMGHIALAAPVAHIWFLRSVPSKIGLILNLTTDAVEKVIYFASFIVTEVKDELKEDILHKLEGEYKAKTAQIKKEYEALKKLALENPKVKEKELDQVEVNFKERQLILKQNYARQSADLNGLKPMKVLTEIEYQEMATHYGHLFEVGIGAEAIKKLLEKVDLGELIKELKVKMAHVDNFENKKLLQRMKLAEALYKNNIQPEWMILTIVPVIPPDLRPMVQLDGGRFASSDLNDLYRRVINRNNRLRRLIDLRAPEVICRNEKRMLQEAVDALVDNGARKTKSVTAASGGKRVLKSLADILRGKQGRFRQNLLGKRVDYSGRSVIVVGPHLKLHQCGLPKTMAIELFKPFVASQLIKRGLVYNLRTASRMIEEGPKEVWDILEEVIGDYNVLLNRAPTLHRLGIQAFQPVLIEGKAIQLHPLVCGAFNADFDGDTMSVHLPISQNAQNEAKKLMLSTNNLLKPATGDPVSSPTQDMVWGCYYMTMIDEPEKDVNLHRFSSGEEACLAYENKKIGLNQRIKVRIDGESIETCVGRVIFNDLLPDDLRDYDKLVNGGSLKAVVGESIEKYGMPKVAEMLDNIKETALKIITESGMSWGMDDIPNLKGKDEIVEKAEVEVEKIEEQFHQGLLSENEKHNKILRIWERVKEEVSALGEKALDRRGPVYTMMHSKARGSWTQIHQMLSMKGLVSNPVGDTIELPVKSSFKEGFDVLEFFISTHGARKGLTDVALRTASAGYLTRRLVDVAHELIITEEDCGDKEGLVLTKEESEAMGETLVKRIIGRVSLEKVMDEEGKKVIIEVGKMITPDKLKILQKMDLPSLRVRSILGCESARGVCQKCYGMDLGTNKMVELGMAVGVVAAQSIGEPGTQLTLRTFHTGGVAGSDITQGLPRVEELLEARAVKFEAFLSEVSGKVKIGEEEGQRKITIVFEQEIDTKYPVTKEAKIKVKDGAKVKRGAVLAISNNEKVIAKSSGIVTVKSSELQVTAAAKDEKEYIIPSSYSILVQDGQTVEVGDQLTEGSLDLQKLYKYKGAAAVQRYIIKEIQHIYSSQGQGLNDKHMEAIVRQMFSRVQVMGPGDSELLQGEVMSRGAFEEAKRKVKAAGGKVPKARNLLLGITRVSLSTDSFLSAASFQETSRILINAALTGRKDHLIGLKENVIIGRLIPVGTGFKKGK